MDCLSDEKAEVDPILATKWFTHVTQSFILKTKQLLGIKPRDDACAINKSSKSTCIKNSIMNGIDADRNKEEENQTSGAITGRFGDNHSLLKISDVPSYLRFNPFVLTGYRSPKLSFFGCCQSMTYFHNETINVLTHGIPFLYFLICFHKMMPWPEIDVPLLPYFHFLGLVSPWLGSSIYHLFMNHKLGDKVYFRLLQFDVIGIWVTQSFGAATTVYTSVAVFALWLRVLFIGTYVILSIRSLKLGVLANDVWERRASFAFLFIMRIIALMLRIHSGHNHSMLLFHVIMQELWPLIGAFISAARIPERFWPGQFDYIFNSHNVMHCFVVFGAVHMHWATCDDLVWLSKNNL